MNAELERYYTLKAQIRKLESIKCFLCANYRRKELEVLKSKLGING